MESAFERCAVVCDDEQFSRALVSSVVEQLGYVVHTCATATEAIALADEFDPDIMVIDLDLGEGPTGIDALIHIREQAPWVAGVVLTGHRSPRMVRRDLPTRLDGVSYLVKSELRSAQDLATGIEAAVNGSQSTTDQPDNLPRLTPAQVDLLRMITDGLSNEEIARQRDCSVRSTERLVARLYQSLAINTHPGVNARVVAARMYRDGQVTIR